MVGLLRVDASNAMSTDSVNFAVADSFTRATASSMVFLARVDLRRRGLAFAVSFGVPPWCRRARGKLLRVWSVFDGDAMLRAVRDHDIARATVWRSDPL
jgi:hypothetical protein